MSGARPRLSVVIPAHDEATVIGRTVSRMLAGGAGAIEVVVVANGCGDDTAERARAASPSARVIEISEASKPAALNAGDAAASVYPRAYVDADVAIEAAALLALADVLDRPGGPLVASPRLRVDATGSGWSARQFYRVWELSDFRRTAHIGSGVYALSREGRERFDAFPDVIADDRFVQQLFRPEERLTLPDHEFAVGAPATLTAQIRRAVRIRAGNRQLERRFPALRDASPAVDRHGRLVRRVLTRPSMWLSFPFYAYGYLAADLAARRLERAGRLPGWNRDETSRI